MMIEDFSTTVLRNDYLGGGNFLLEFSAPEISGEADPGQFVMLGIPGSETLLRRPFSVCALPGTFRDGADETLHILYKVVGRGTRHLSTLEPEATITILGPLGNGFELPGDPEVRPVLVAGGIGSAPMPALVAALAHESGMRPIMYYGAGTATELPLLQWFEERCEQVVVTTDDGSLGRCGLITGPLHDWLSGESREKLEIMACGPEPMLRAVREIAIEEGIPCQLSLEAHMACGFGVCIGCVVPAFGPGGEICFERVCKEGPVMRAERLAWTK